MVFRDTMLKCATELCDCRHVGQSISKGSELWNDKAWLPLDKK